MIIINNNETLLNFKAWSGAVETQRVIIEEGKSSDFNFLIEELYPEGVTTGELNDILRFESDWVFESLSIKN